jgi:methionyl-tRNA formyltransferase
LNVAFAGTPEFASAALAAIVAAGHQVPLVLTQPDRPAGRGLKLHPSPVKAFALAHGLTLAQPRSLRLDGKFPDDAAAAQTLLLDAAPDVMVVAAYGLLLPPWVLALPRLGCLNIHASLLPRWRGAAPIHRAIEAGDAQTGITIMQMDAGLDTGAMLLAQAEPIHADDTTGSLHERLAALGARLVVQALTQAGALAAQAQPEAGVSYAHKVDKAQAQLDWTQPAAVLERMVRAFNPTPCAWFMHEATPLKVWRAAVLPADHGTPGQLLHPAPGRVAVTCGQGALELLELQAPGGKRLPAEVFLRAHALPPG